MIVSVKHSSLSCQGINGEGFIILARMEILRLGNFVLAEGWYSRNFLRSLL